MEKKWWIIGLIVIIIVGIVVLSYGVEIIKGIEKERNQIIDDKKYCKVNDDCVPNECCHASGCVNKENAPNCKGIMCTMECREGTLDCGYGRCECINNNCEVVSNKI